MTCVDPKTGELVPGTSSCAMCKRQVINAGIARVVVRDTPDEYRIIEVSDWITDDDSLTGEFGY
jgi:dCMP deaminase